MGLNWVPTYDGAFNDLFASVHGSQPTRIFARVCHHSINPERPSFLGGAALDEDWAERPWFWVLASATGPIASGYERTKELACGKAEVASAGYARDEKP